MEDTVELSVMQSIDLAIERGERLNDKQIADIIGPGPKGYFLRLFKFPALAAAAAAVGVPLDLAGNDWSILFLIIGWIFIFLSAAGLFEYGFGIFRSGTFYRKLREGLESGRIIPDFYVPSSAASIPFIIDTHNERIYIKDKEYDLNDVDHSEALDEQGSTFSTQMLALRMRRGENPIVGAVVRNERVLHVQHARLDNFLREYWNGE